MCKIFSVYLRGWRKLSISRCDHWSFSVRILGIRSFPFHLTSYGDQQWEIRMKKNYLIQNFKIIVFYHDWWDEKSVKMFSGIYAIEIVDVWLNSLRSIESENDTFGFTVSSSARVPIIYVTCMIRRKNILQKKKIRRDKKKTFC